MEKKVPTFTYSIKGYAKQLEKIISKDIEEFFKKNKITDKKIKDDMIRNIFDSVFLDKLFRFKNKDFFISEERCINDKYFQNKFNSFEKVPSANYFEYFEGNYYYERVPLKFCHIQEEKEFGKQRQKNADIYFKKLLDPKFLEKYKGKFISFWYDEKENIQICKDFFELVNCGSPTEAIRTRVGFEGTMQGYSLGKRRCFEVL